MQRYLLFFLFLLFLMLLVLLLPWPLCQSIHHRHQLHQFMVGDTWERQHVLSTSCQCHECLVEQERRCVWQRDRFVEQSHWRVHLVPGRFARKLHWNALRRFLGRAKLDGTHKTTTERPCPLFFFCWQIVVVSCLLSLVSSLLSLLSSLLFLHVFLFVP